MACFEKYDLTSIVVYDDVALYIESLNQSFPITDLILVGYSAGGVVSSHIMSRLRHLSCTKK
jgi:thioesterase domain-containing protein